MAEAAFRQSPTIKSTPALELWLSNDKKCIIIQKVYVQWSSVPPEDGDIHG